MYINGEEIFMKLHVVGKFIKMDEMQNSVDMEEEAYNQTIVSENYLIWRQCRKRAI